MRNTSAFQPKTVPAITLSFLQSASSTSDTNAYTFSAQNIGTASADRYIIVATSARKAGATTTLSSVTVGGVSATILKQQTTAVTNTNVCGIAMALVPTGTTGDVVVTYGATMVRAGISLYAVTGLNNPTVFDSGGSSATAPTYNIDVPAGGFVIGIGSTVSNTTATWTELTEDTDIVIESTLLLTTASKQYGTSQTDKTVTATFGATEESVGAFVSLGNLSSTKAYYPLNGNSNDYSGNTNTGTDTAITYPQGRFGQGAKFNGSSSRIILANETNFDFERTNSFTISAWIKTSQTLTTAEYNIWSKGDGTATTIEFVQEYNQGKLGLHLRNNFGTGNKVDIYGSTLINDNKWHSVIATYGGGSNAASCELYVDGRKETKTIITDALSATILNNLQAYMGTRNAASQFWNGDIDEVIIESRAWTAAEIETYYKKSLQNYKRTTFSGIFYTMLAELGTYALTGQTSNLLKGFKLLADLGTYTLTGISVGLMKGFGMIASAGTYTLTGIDAGLRAARQMTAAVGSYVYTGVSATLTKAFGIIASAGSYVLTGVSAILRPSNIWTNRSKNSTTWTEQSKSDTTWTNLPKA